MTGAPSHLPRVALISDLREEQWHSMDLVSELLLLGLRHPGLRAVEATELCPRLVRRATRLPWARDVRRVATLDRIVNRFWDYPRWLRARTAEFDLFHIVDHSYAHLAADLPAHRTLVMCHDLDAFEAALPGAARRPPLARAMAQRLLDGLRRAARVVCGSRATRDALVETGVVPSARVAVVPYGIHPTCSPRPDVLADAEAEALLGPVDAEVPEILHVGSVVARKRIDLLLDVFSNIRARHSRARLVRVGGPLTGAQQRQADRLGLANHIVTMPFVDRRVLAAVYRRAALVLQPSEREGFGLPVAEAMGCGTPVVASLLPALREAGGYAAVYCRVGDVHVWTNTVSGLLDERERHPEIWERRRADALHAARRFDALAHARG
ncbi:MAG TPA: glycosyltransferase, partial [Gemmatimonadales bacterium]|nr:glycosyltransferase [Gemmatimonadales bacterium]